jgi:hypothetical protein
MIAETWPPVTYWLTADDRMLATAVEVLEARQAAYEEATRE